VVTCLWTLAALAIATTDALDGSFARVLGVESQLGTIVDPVVDRCYCIALFWALWGLISGLKPGTLLVLQLSFAVRVMVDLLLIVGSPLWLIRRYQLRPNEWGKKKFTADVVMIAVSFPLVSAAYHGSLDRNIPMTWTGILLTVASYLGARSLIGYWQVREKPGATGVAYDGLPDTRT
jgi:phosphatidylglycerophosphate synthase